MLRISTLALVCMLALAGCQSAPQQQLGPDGQPLPVAYKITPKEEAQIAPRVMAQINGLRANVGAPPVAQSPMLDQAAKAHARDMSAQNRAWHFGSDGSSPLDRIRRQGYYGHLIGENISETYENDITTLNAWMQNRDTRDVIMDPRATDFGIGWYQEPSGKIWWVLLTGGAGGTPMAAGGYTPGAVTAAPL
ncbi:CAP domain-containing protein [Paracoccus yeei]|uniref:CAP domain-containing protein n=2 Tax=Paracoccus TaxID=265 RepID=A0A1V0GSX1_9RHOB|nr:MULTISPECIES: CAP domain-containing protein [Paracoccus]ARC36933.1 CAP domain-containing protein [Paracoccus yeei]ATQ55461.1 CAP domain-containing protein [Paracoccus yeei]AWX93323.1 CAP domain-containing protein [Paracoccus mutanolyticus]AYF02985.1 CAP domain-containing protein [Paracoccus yeei]MBY0136778.1 CAP domain-containing protein [Paracoccus yeei]